MPSPSFFLKSITLRAFRSVVDEQVIPLPSRGMHLLLGPSGAGKTTVGEGIAFALGYSNHSAVALQSWDWLTKEALRDTLELETTRGTLKVTRGKSASIHMPGEEKPRTSAKAVKEGLTQALGLDPERFLAPLTYRSQKTPGLFLSMVDSEKKSFLTQLLGLEHFEVAIKKAVDNVSAFRTEVERAETRVTTLQTAVPAEPQAPTYIDVDHLRSLVAAAEREQADVQKALEDTKALDIGLTTKQAQAVEAAKAEWRPRLVAAKQAFETVPPADTGELMQQLVVIRSTAQKYVNEHRTALDLLRKERDDNVSLRYGLQAMVDKRDRAERDLKAAEVERARLLSGQCYTCKREWADDPHKAAALSDVDARIATATKTIADANTAAAQLPVMDAATADLDKRIKTMESTDPVPPEMTAMMKDLDSAVATASAVRSQRVAELKAEFHKLKAEAEAAVSALAAMTPEEEQVRRTLADLNNLLNAKGHAVQSSRASVEGAIRENETGKRYYEAAKSTRISAQMAVQQASEVLRVAERNLAQEQDFLGMVRGFLSFIFDETLATIADRTNARLALISNVSDLTIHFTSERETGEGKLRQEITPVCEKNGHIIPLKSGVSGGMYSAVELAVDLSLADVIADRTGVYPGWLVLDEAFEGLDEPAKAACFEMLKTISNERAVFVVDHSNMFQEMFDSKICMNFDGERTTVKVS